MLKPPNKGGMESHVQPKLAPSNPCLTRSATQAAASGKPISQQSLAKELSTKEHNKDRIVEETIDVAAPATYRITSTLIALLQPIVEALNKILDGKDSKEQIIEGIFRYIRESEKTERAAREKQEV
jgi:hypothetical protein